MTPENTSAASTAPQLKYYVGRLAAEYIDALSAVTAYGIPENEAQQFILEAQINRSEAIVIGGLFPSVYKDDEGKHGLLVVAPHGARWRSWIGIPEYFDTEDEAREFVRELEESLKPKKFTWTVMSYVTAPQLRVRQ